MQITDILSSIQPVDRLLVCTPGVPGENVDFWIWFRSFQGLINRDRPHLYLVQGRQNAPKREPRELCETHWLDYYTKTYGLPTESLDNVDGLVERYKHLVDGYVVYDNASVIQTQNLAITRAGLENVLPIAPDQEEWMTRHGIPKRDDLRGKFASDADAAEWAIDNLWPHCCKRLYANFCVHRPFWYALSHALEDFIVYHKGMALDLPLSRQSRRTLNLYRRMLESGAAPGVQMNWHCICDQEKEYVAEAAERGYFTLCSVYTPNLTIHGGVGDEEAAYTQPTPEADECRAEPGKVYVCFYVSDGDATWAMNNLHSNNWLEPGRGKYKLGWGLLPFMAKLMPGMLRYYHETRTANDCFWGPSSGVGYTYTHLWPDHLVDGYLSETRRLLHQTGQHGCNMVNWFLRDWWREVEDDAAILREQEALQSGPGLVCGLGGSPYAKSYLDGPIPKLHSVHIANVGRDNLGDIVRFAKECPTRPAFMFLFAQIAKGVFGQLESEMEAFAQHADIEILSMDAFFVTLRDAMDRGLLKETLYETNDALAETWLKAPGRHRLPICEHVTAELSDVAHAEPEERRRRLAEGGWIDLVSAEIENVARDRDTFLTKYTGRPAPTEAEEADAFLYVTFTVGWTLVRSAIESQGIYANHRTQCLNDFMRLCGEWVDTEPFEELFAAWDAWEDGAPAVETIVGWCDALAAAARVLRDQLGPDETEDFEGWPPRTI
jgi:GxGYxYP putative glycoside hydrolase C-terminal domain/GxGYxYP_N second domain/GxGYxYP_N 1st domain/GxGYxYP third domain